MDYTIYILAQGKSSRMGTDKGLIKIANKEMILHCIENVKSLGQEIVIITDNQEYEQYGCRTISDKTKNQGPAQGIITALEDSQIEKNVILSCDMPLISALMISRFDGLMIDSDIVLYSDEFLFPFPGVYSKSILTKWKSAVNSGERKMQRLIPMFDYKTLPIENLDLFLNVNTPQDILLAEELL